MQDANLPHTPSKQIDWIGLSESRADSIDSLLSVSELVNSEASQSTGSKMSGNSTSGGPALKAVKRESEDGRDDNKRQAKKLNLSLPPTLLVNGAQVAVEAVTPSQIDHSKCSSDEYCVHHCCSLQCDFGLVRTIQFGNCACLGCSAIPRAPSPRPLSPRPPSPDPRKKLCPWSGCKNFARENSACETGFCRKHCGKCGNATNREICNALDCKERKQRNE